MSMTPEQLREEGIECFNELETIYERRQDLENDFKLLELKLKEIRLAENIPTIDNPDTDHQKAAAETEAALSEIEDQINQLHRYKEYIQDRGALAALLAAVPQQ